MTISNYAENAFLEALRGTSFSAASTYVQLHTGDPGEDGTNNVASESTRKTASWNAASSGSMTTSATIEWTNVSTTETYTHWSLWNAVTSGDCLWYGALGSSAAMTAGDTFQLTSLALALD